jgi:response regulator RpfG family c-di-GMP phosphodiesterase
VGHIVNACNAREALEAIESGDFDIVLCDQFMPGAEGLELLAMAERAQWDIAIILMTGRPEIEDIIMALRLQAYDFLLKPFGQNEVVAAVDRTYRKLLLLREARVNQRSREIAVERRTRDLESALRNVEANYQGTLEALVAALDAREHETFAHSFRVRALTLELSRVVGYPPALLPTLGQASLLHDVGKIAIADAILLKPGKLTEEEWMEMKKHPAAGEQLLRRVPFLKESATLVRHHHERYDGTGYPDGLAGDRIPLGARLFVFADTLDAMLSDRVYRKAPGIAAACEEIRRCAGTQFDPKIVKAFNSVPGSMWQEVLERTQLERIGREESKSLVLTS